MSVDKNLGRLNVSVELIENLLGFKPDHKILNMQLEPNRGVVHLKIEGPSLPLVRYGEVIPLVEACVEEKDGKVETNFKRTE